MSIDFSSTYQPPGVYIEEDTTPLVSVIGVQPTVVAIVGPGQGYRLHTDTVVLTDTTPEPLSQLGIDITNVTVTLADGTVVDPSQYALVVTGSDETSATTIARTSGSTITNGGTVYVTYQYTDDLYFTPLRASNFEDVKDIFGPPLDLTTGDILSPLSLASKVAFENGATQLVLVATEGTPSSVTRTALTDGYAKLAAFDDVDILVPLPVGITGAHGSLGDSVNVGADLKAEVEADAAATLFRIGIIGYDKIVTADPAIDLVSGFSSSRVMLVWPNRVNYYNGETNLNIEVSGYYLAAGVAGRMASQLPQTPVTRKQVRGFSGFPGTMQAAMSTTQKNAWAAAGVCVVEIARTGQMLVRHGVSTDPTSVNTREVSLTRGKDAMVGLIQATLESTGLIGSSIDANTLLVVKGIVTGGLETAKRVGVIIDYANLVARQRSVDPSVIEVKFQYQPAYPLNYIVVVFSINTTTGEVTPITLSNAA